MDADERMASGSSDDGELSSDSSPARRADPVPAEEEDGEISGPASPDQETLLTADSSDGSGPSDGEEEEVPRSSPPPRPSESEVNRRLSKTNLPEEHVELDYEEDGMEEEEEVAADTTGGTGEENAAEMEELDNGDDEKEEGEHTDDSGELSSSGGDGEIKDDEDDDCEEGEIKEAEGDDEQPPPTNTLPAPHMGGGQGDMGPDDMGVMRASNRNLGFVPPGICRFFLRGQCTWGMQCRFNHPGDNGFVGGDRSYGPGPSASMVSRLGVRGRPRTNSSGQWNPDGVTEGDGNRPAPAEPTVESAWERGLRHAKEIRKKASKRKETDVDFEEKRVTLKIEEDKENKENENGKTTSLNEPFEPDEYYDKLGGGATTATDGWRGGQYENFEVRWTRNDHHHPAEYSPPPPAPFDQRMAMERGRPFDKRRGDERVRYSPDRTDLRKAKFDKLDKRYRGYRDEKAAGGLGPPKKARGDEWKDPWRRSKSPDKKRDSSSRSRSRGRHRVRRRRSYSKGSGASSYSSSSYSSRSRSSSYSSYTSRSSYSGSSSRSSRSSSRSRSPARRNEKQSDRRQQNVKNTEPPKSMVNKLGGIIPRRGRPGGQVGGTFPGRGRGAPSNRGAAAAPNTRRPVGGAAQGQPTAPPGRGRGALQLRPLVGGGIGGAVGKGRGERNGAIGIAAAADTRGKHHDPAGRRRRRSSAGRSSGSRSSSASSISSAASSSAYSSSGSADSDHLYRDMGGKAGAAPKSAATGAARKVPKEPLKGAPPAKKTAPNSKDSSQPAQRVSSSTAKPDGTQKPAQDGAAAKPADKLPERAANTSGGSAAAVAHKSRMLRGPHPTGPSRINAQTVAPITMQVKSTKQLKYPAKMPEQEGRRKDRRPSQDQVQEQRTSGASEQARVAAGRRPLDHEAERKTVSQGRVEAEQRLDQGRDAERRPDRQLHDAASRSQDASRLADSQPSRVAEGRVPSAEARPSSRQPTQSSRATDSRSRATETRGAASQSRPPEGGRLPSGRESGRSKVDGSRIHQSSTAPPAAIATSSPTTKDLMKVAGQKSSIKLTLISKGEKATSSPAKKRPPDASSVAPPPAKRSAKAADTSTSSSSSKPVPSKPPPRSPAKAAAASSQPPKGRSDTTQKVTATQPSKITPTAAPPKKKSTCMSSRREELLKQLKAVEDAIAKKRSKM